MGFDEKIECRCTVLLDSHEDVAKIVLDEYGVLIPMELIKKSLDDVVYKRIWQNGIGKTQIIPYYIMANTKSDFNIKKLSKKQKWLKQ